MIIIGADIVPTASNIQYFEDGVVNELISDRLQALMDHADYRILNLEVPLTDKSDPIIKCGPNLIASTRSIEAIKNMRIDLLTLANNHIMDQGIHGLLSTVETLKDANISYVGIGKKLDEASKPFCFEIKERKYGVYACAEHEFSIAEVDYPGANPFDPLESLSHIEQLKEQCDYVIVLYHGGKEHYRYPSPNLQKTCRKMVEKGADLVVCQHSHCVGCMEEYICGTIIYGQGNFLFDGQNNEYWNSSVLIGIDDDGKIKYYPLQRRGRKIELASGNESENILDGFFQRSEEIKKPGVICNRYNDYSQKFISNYVMQFSGAEGNLIFRIINKLSGQRFKKKIIKRYLQQHSTVIRNFVECEAHRELLLDALKTNHYE